jgi:hypothetical protein
MVKRKIVETIKEYDNEGRLVTETVTETTEDDDTRYEPFGTRCIPLGGDIVRWALQNLEREEGECRCKE